MQPLRIVLAEDEPITRMDIKEMLHEENLLVVGECGDGVTAVNMVKNIKPDLVIMDINMPLMSGLEAARLLLNTGQETPVLILTAFSGSEVVSQAEAAGVLGYLVKPVTRDNLIPAVRVAISRYKEFAGLRSEILNLNESLKNRKVIEKAKGLLQKKYVMSEEQAYNKIRAISKKQHKSMSEVAQAIIISLGNGK